MTVTLGSATARISLGGGSAVASILAPAPLNAYATGTFPTDKVTYQDGTLDVYDPVGPLVYSHTPRFRGRGNSTWIAPKKPLKVRSLNRQQTPLSFPASRDWALMADYFDQSYIRSMVGFEVARRATGRWAPRSRHVRLFWNDTYQGLYRYSETADVQVGRNDIRAMSNSDNADNALTGPYVLEVNNPLDDPGFTTVRNTPVLYDVPDVGGIAAQEVYIQGWVASLETALVTGTEAEILALIDLPSWVDWYLLQESIRSIDSGWKKSCKWFKDQDAPAGTGKAVLWPPWDFDLTFANQSVENSPAGTDGWTTRTGPNADQGTYPNWLYYAWERSPVFRAAVRDAWTARFKPVLEGIGPFIDARAAEVAAYIDEDRAKWRAGAALPTMHTAAYMKSWLTARISWLTANL